MTSLPRRRPTVRQVRRACRLIEACGARGDDPAAWAGRLLGGLPAVAGGRGWVLAFPDAGVVLAANPDGPAAAVPRRHAAGWLAAAAGAAAGERVAGAAPWADRCGRRAILLAVVPPPGDEPHRFPTPGATANGVPPRRPDAAGPPDVADALAALVARGLRRHGRRLTFPGEPAPGDLPPKTREVLYRLLRGESEKEIAAAAGVTQGAVHKHVHRAYQHFGVGSRGRLLAHWLNRGWGRACDWRPRPAEAFGAAPEPSAAGGADDDARPGAAQSAAAASVQ